MGDLEYTVHDSLTPEFACRCSLEGIKGLLTALGRAEIEDMIAKEGTAQVRCHFCNETYNLSRTDLEELLGTMP